jgi:N6-adenosine-specific RNA methylase IME4
MSGEARPTFAIHPAATLFPLLSDQELEDLTADIKQKGQLDPIRLFEGQILDGRNRYRACQKLEIEPRFVDLPDDINPWEYAWSVNAERRHLAPGTRAMVFEFFMKESGAWEEEHEQARAEANRKRSAAVRDRSRTEDGVFLPSPPLFEGGLEDTERSRHKGSATDAKNAQASGVSEATQARAKALLESRPDLALKVKDNEITLNEGMRLMKKAEVLLKAGALPEGVFRVVYADPPWKYNNSGSGLDQYGPAERHYPAMTIAELCALDVKSRLADDAVLFLWVTSPFLDECWPIITAWGFEYKSSFIWDKVKHNYGHYNSVRHELLLICTRGSCTPENSQLFDSVQSIERTQEHSEKPEEFRAIIETLYPTGHKLELFGRAEAPGWVIYGNELMEVAT